MKRPNFGYRDCIVIAESAISTVMPVVDDLQVTKAGNQNIEYSLDFPVSSTGQAQSRALLEFIRRMLGSPE